jgi:hypothetical protein
MENGSTMKTRPKIILLCGLIAALSPTPHLDARETSKLVLVHYMPWYASQPVSGRWGWHWTMNHFDPDTLKSNGQREAACHDYPLIDLYDSNDPDLLECHVLLMKFAGIDGVVIDWYGKENFRDYAEIHRNSEHLIKHVKRAGLRFAICYEDQTVGHMVKAGVLPKQRSVAHGCEVLEWLDEHWFADGAYVRIDGRPILLVFGPQYFQREDWGQILSGLPEPPRLYALPHLAEQAGTDGVFGWPPVHGGREVTPSVWRRYLRTLYDRSDASQSAIAVAFPAFRDIYQQARLHASYGSIDGRDGQTFVETFDLARASASRVIQIATWNDYGEGTVVEPTTGAGYRYLQYIQENSTVRSTYCQSDLRLPVTLYQLKKRHARNSARGKQLRIATDLLFAGKCDETRAVLLDASRDK